MKTTTNKYKAKTKNTTVNSTKHKMLSKNRIKIDKNKFNSRKNNLGLQDKFTMQSITK